MPPTFLAEFTPLSASAQLAIISILSLAVTGLTIYALWPKRKPALDTELAQFSASLKNVEAAFGKSITALETSVSGLSKAMAAHATHETEIAALQERVRTLEARRETDQQSSRTYMRETTREIFERLEKVSTGFAENTKSLERAMGQVEGKLEGLTDRMDSIEIITVKKA